MHPSRHARPTAANRLSSIVGSRPASPALRSSYRAKRGTLARPLPQMSVARTSKRDVELARLTVERSVWELAQASNASAGPQQWRRHISPRRRFEPVAASEKLCGRSRKRSKRPRRAANFCAAVLRGQAEAVAERCRGRHSLGTHRHGPLRVRRSRDRRLHLGCGQARLSLSLPVRRSLRDQQGPCLYDDRAVLRCAASACGRRGHRDLPELLAACARDLRLCVTSAKALS